MTNTGQGGPGGWCHVAALFVTWMTPTSTRASPGSHGSHPAPKKNNRTRKKKKKRTSAGVCAVTRTRKHGKSLPPGCYPLHTHNIYPLFPFTTLCHGPWPWPTA